MNSPLNDVPEYKPSASLPGQALFFIGLLALLAICTSDWIAGLLTQFAVMAVLAISFHALFYTTGLMSFGHAVFPGVGGFAVVILLNQGISLPETHLLRSSWIVPCLPGIAGLIAAALASAIGWLATRQAGAAFAMITLGLGELVHAFAQMLPMVFGGEAGITTNRVLADTSSGSILDWGDSRWIAVLALVWLALALVWAQRLPATPLGRLARANRDQAERVPWLGYSPRTVRTMVCIVAGFWGGVAGGLSALQFEVFSVTSFSLDKSSIILMASLLGGSHPVLGPLTGAAVYIGLSQGLGLYTQAWPMALGILLIGVVLGRHDGVWAWLIGAQGHGDSAASGYKRATELAQLILLPLRRLGWMLLMIYLLDRIYGWRFGLPGVTMDTPVLTTSLALVIIVAFTWAVRRRSSLHPSREAVASKSERDHANSDD